MSVHELYTILQERQIDISIANLYRMVQVLTDQYVLIKKAGRLQLHSSWITELQQLGQQLSQRMSWHYHEILDLADGEQFVVRAATLLDIETQWVDIAMTLNLHAPARDWYFWYNEHSYFTLGVPNIEADANQKFVKNALPIYGIIGSDTSLDRWCKEEQLKAQDNATNIVISADTVFKKTPGYCLNIYGDWVIELVLPLQVRSLCHMYFDNVQSIDLLDTEWYTSLFTLKNSYKLMIRRDASQAKKLKKVISSFF